MVSLNIKKEKSIWASFSLVNTSLDKSLLGQKSAWTTVSLDKSPLDNCLLGQWSLGQLLQHPISFWTQIFGPHFSCIQNFFGPKNLCYLIFFWTTLFWTWKLFIFQKNFGPKIFLDPTIFGTNFFLLKITLDQIFLNPCFI